MYSSAIATDLVEVEFKGARRQIFSNADDLIVKVGDVVIVKAEKGIDAGKVRKVGRLVHAKEINEEPRKILRQADLNELNQLEQLRHKEAEVSVSAKETIKKLRLNMKLVDVEIQFDNNKMTFFFTSDKRVDFRDLVKELAGEFKTRIELKQIGVRDESRRVGGCGNCGRELCCTSFIKEFDPISTQYAKDQNLPLNPGKLSGACGRLMCCLGYEREFYQETLKRFPAIDSHYTYDDKRMSLIKIDIFREYLNFKTQTDDYISLSLDEFNLGLQQEYIKLIQH